MGVPFLDVVGHMLNQLAIGFSGLQINRRHVHRLADRHVSLIA